MWSKRKKYIKLNSFSFKKLHFLKNYANFAAK